MQIINRENGTNADSEHYVTNTDRNTSDGGKGEFNLFWDYYVLSNASMNHHKSDLELDCLSRTGAFDWLTYQKSLCNIVILSPPYSFLLHNPARLLLR